VSCLAVTPIAGPSFGWMIQAAPKFDLIVVYAWRSGARSSALAAYNTVDP